MSAIKRWVGWVALVIVFSIACVALSNWQFSRRTEAVEKNQLVENNYSQTPVELSALISADAFDSKLEWRPIKLQGKFLTDAAVLVRNRPYNGQPGFLEVVPFQTEDLQIVAIELGWIPAGEGLLAPTKYPLPPTNSMQIVARIREAEPTLGRSAPVGQIPTINIDSLVSQTKLAGKVYRSFYLRATENYANLPKIQAMPELTEGNHLSYALQWLMFALMAAYALFWAIRKELLIRSGRVKPNVKNKLLTLGDKDAAAEDEILNRK